LQYHSAVVTFYSASCGSEASAGEVAKVKKHLTAAENEVVQSAIVHKVFRAKGAYTPKVPTTKGMTKSSHSGLPHNVARKNPVHQLFV